MVELTWEGKYDADGKRAETEPGHDLLHGRKGGCYVHIGELDSEMTIENVRRAVAELESLGADKLDVLA